MANLLDSARTVGHLLSPPTNNFDLTALGELPQRGLRVITNWRIGLARELAELIHGLHCLNVFQSVYGLPGQGERVVVRQIGRPQQRRLMQRLDAGRIAKLGERRDSVLVTLVPRSDGQGIEHAKVLGRHPEPMREVEAKLDRHWVTISKAAFQHVSTDLGHLGGIRGISVMEVLLAELAEQ